MASLTLVVMAAGVGSRYGGLKQIDGFGPSGEAVMEYSVYDALRAGFDRAVFIIRRDFDVRLVFGLIIIALILGGSIVTLTVSLKLGGRIFENLSWDISAQSRILIFRVFEFVRLDDVAAQPGELFSHERFSGGQAAG